MMENLKCCGYCTHGKHIPITDYTVICDISTIPRPVESDGCGLFMSIFEKEEKERNEMTIGQAIDLLDNLIGMVEDNQNNDYDSALCMAIEALKQLDEPCKEENDG